ncbi:MAG: hypothetical protein WCF19_04790 [Chlamydiales bacterium]
MAAASARSVARNSLFHFPPADMIIKQLSDNVQLIEALRIENLTPDFFPNLAKHIGIYKGRLTLPQVAYVAERAIFSAGIDIPESGLDFEKNA